MSMHRGMPVIASVEDGRQLAWRSYISVGRERMSNFVWIFLMDAAECKGSEPCCLDFIEFWLGPDRAVNTCLQTESYSRGRFRVVF